MSHSINLDGLSREDLLDLAKRIEQRLLTFPVASGTTTENARAGFRDDGIDVDDPWAAPCPTSTVGTPGPQATFSEKIQELNFVNDPWEGTPTRWSLPFYGGHIVRTPDNIVSVPYITNGPATLPVFGTPCQSFGGPLYLVGTAKTAQSTPRILLWMLLLLLSLPDVDGPGNVSNAVAHELCQAVLYIKHKDCIHVRGIGWSRSTSCVQVPAPSVQLLKSVGGLTQKLAAVLVMWVPKLVGDCFFCLSISFLTLSIARLPFPAFILGNCTSTTLEYYPVYMCTPCKHLGLQQVLG